MNKVKKGILIHLVVFTIILYSSVFSFAAQAKNIILMIGDGMGPAHLHTTWLYATRQLGRNLVMTEIMDKGQTAYMVNDTADSTVTESAAAAVQMATGVKVLAKSMGIAPEGLLCFLLVSPVRNTKGSILGQFPRSKARGREEIRSWVRIHLQRRLRRL